MLRTFELHEYRPQKNSLLPHFAIAEKNDSAFGFNGITADGEKNVWTNPDDAAAVRDAIEKEHGLDLYVLRLYADGQIEEVSWPKDVPRLLGAIETPDAGTW